MCVQNWKFVALSVPQITGAYKKIEFGHIIHRVHPNKSPWKISEKRAWAYPGTAHFWIPRLCQQLCYTCTLHMISVSQSVDRLCCVWPDVSLLQLAALYTCTAALLSVVSPGTSWTNCSARRSHNGRKCDRISPLRRHLHRLRVTERI